MNEAEDRAWEVVRRAFEERTPARRRTAHGRWAVPVLAALAAAVVLAVVSPPGRAVFQRVREVVGVQRADPALFSLPAPGRLLVVSHGAGAWLVLDNGMKSKLGPYTDAEWSPHGLYAVVTRPGELAALDVDHGIRWTLARAGVTWPRWEGSRTDTRIAYFAASGLRVVGGDGRDDRLLDAHALRIAAAWRPRTVHTLAYVSGGQVVVRQVDTRRVLWRSPLGSTRPLQLAWSDDGRYLAVVSADAVRVLGASGRLVRTMSSLAEQISSAEFRPGTHQLALASRTRTTPARTSFRLVDVDRPGHARLLFAGPGRFGDATWSPNGAWLLLDWRAANQWLFVSPGTKPRVHAVANIVEEFPRRDDVVPRLSFQGRWCCR